MLYGIRYLKRFFAIRTYNSSLTHIFSLLRLFLSLYQLPQLVIAVNYIVFHVIAADSTEMLTGAVGFCFFNFKKTRFIKIV